MNSTTARMGRARTLSDFVDVELLRAGVRVFLVAASFVGAVVAAGQGKIIDAPSFFGSLGLLYFAELVPPMIIVDRRLEFAGWHKFVRRAATLACTYIYVPLRVGMWLSPIYAAVFVSPRLLLIAVPLVAWGEWLLWELGQKVRSV